MFKTLSQGEAFQIKELLYHHNQGIKLSVRVDWREEAAAQVLFRAPACDPPEPLWWYIVLVATEVPLDQVVRAALKNLPHQYVVKVMTSFRKLTGIKPRLSG